MQTFVRDASVLPDALERVNHATMLLASSTELFLTIRDSMKRCLSLKRANLISRLYKEVYQVSLVGYARFLATAVPAGKTAGLRTLCHIANTAHYCLKMVTQLEETIQKSLDKKGEVHEAVSWHDYVDAQHAASAAAAGVAVQNLRPILKKVQDVAAAARRGETIGQSTNMGQLGSGLG